MSDRHPGIPDPLRECREHVTPFLRTVSDWQARYRPFSPEWLQLSKVTSELQELAFVLRDRPRPGPFEGPSDNDA